METKLRKIMVAAVTMLILSGCGEVRGLTEQTENTKTSKQEESAQSSEQTSTKSSDKSTDESTDESTDRSTDGVTKKVVKAKRKKKKAKHQKDASVIAAASEETNENAEEKEVAKESEPASEHTAEYPQTHLSTQSETSEVTADASVEQTQPSESKDETKSDTVAKENKGNAAQGQEVIPAPEIVVAGQEEKRQEETFSGVLIDEDCHDFEDPPMHDLPCMLMDSCRTSGYGLDILQGDGSYQFYMFDEKGQQLAWEYLNQTTRMYGLYVTVTGTYENGVIAVHTLKEN